MTAVGMFVQGAIAFAVTWCVVALVLRIGMVDDARIAIPVLIACSTVVALLAAARVRRNRNSA